MTQHDTYIRQAKTRTPSLPWHNMDNIADEPDEVPRHHHHLCDNTRRRHAYDIHDAVLEDDDVAATAFVAQRYSFIY